MIHGIARHDIIRHCSKQLEIRQGDVVEVLRTNMYGSDLLISKPGSGKSLVVFPEYIEILSKEDNWLSIKHRTGDFWKKLIAQ